jgi:two-component system CheB/CheR fusion protein
MPSRKSVRPAKKENRKRPQKKKGPKGTAAPAGPAVKAGAREGGDELIVVGIGASAGGLEAVSQLLEAMPVNTGMAFVVVQHLAPRHTSALPSLLGGVTSMSVVQVTDRMKIVGDHVYVIPPDRQMELTHSTLRLAPRPAGHAQYTPIDHFFRSMALHAGERAVGVVLSGTASDGSLGLKEIKAAGGITIAQDPKTAAYGGMPMAAVSTGAVDLVLPVSAIASHLQRIANHSYVRSAAQGWRSKDVKDSGFKADETHMQRIFALLRAMRGVDFSLYKPPTIQRRIQRRMALQKIEEIEPYIRFLKENPGEVEALYQDILIQVTHFFREPDALNHLRKSVFPRLLHDRPDDSPIRIWIPGCATGEEVYSVAILLLESFEAETPASRIQIFGTDVSEAAVEYARRGSYPEAISEHVSPERLRRFFTHVNGSYRINKVVRDLCVFARQDLTRDPPFSRLDLVLCRNVLIYLGAILQQRLMMVFHYALRPSGYLILGKAETVGSGAELFSVVDKKHRIYTRRHKDFPQTMMVPSEITPYKGMPTPRRQVVPERGANPALALANQFLLEQYAPPGVVVDNNLQIVQFRGQTGAFLEPSPGNASLNLLKMAREGLIYGLRTALHAARKKGEHVSKDGLRIRSNGGYLSVGLDVFPLGSREPDRHFLIVFRGQSAAAEPSARAKPKPGARPDSRKDGRVTMLQQELAASRDYLQSMIQDLEAANEELQSANEEILSSNEELQSTNEELDTAKEELQSINEELNTVNEELHGRNEELSKVNSDLMNLLNNVQIAIVMVGSDFKVRRFTPMAERLLNLIPGDLGRPLGNIHSNIDCPDLMETIAEVIDTVTPHQRDVQDRQGRWYSLTLRPYKNAVNQIDGAVLVLYDVDAAHRNEILAERQRELARGLLEMMGEPSLLLDADLRIRGANGAFTRRYPLPIDPTGAQLHELPLECMKSQDLRNALDALLKRGDRSMQSIVSDGCPMIQARRLPGEDGRGALLLLLREERPGRDAQGR